MSTKSREAQVRGVPDSPLSLMEGDAGGLGLRLRGALNPERA